MPFINTKVTVPLSEEKKDILKSEFGKAISIIGKPESYLMLGFEDNSSLYFAGEKLDKGAFISVQVLGNVNSESSSRMTAKLCEILKKELDIPGNAVYVAYQGIKDWGWDGRNF